MRPAETCATIIFSCRFVPFFSRTLHVLVLFRAAARPARTAPQSAARRTREAIEVCATWRPLDSRAAGHSRLSHHVYGTSGVTFARSALACKSEPRRV